MGVRRVVLALVLIAACDSKAKLAEPGGGAASTEQRSKEYESCGASLDCQDGLRCLDQVCRRSARSTVGDYQVALGAAARARGDVEGAIAAYAAALGHYEAEKLTVPPDVDCAYGAALAAGKATKQHGELGARVLHRCVLAVPPSGALRDGALAQLATLGDVGLDPLLLGASKTADVYLTKGAGAGSDKVAVTVTANPQPTGKSYAKIPEKLAAPEIKTALVACWEKHRTATRLDELSVTLGLKVAFVGSPDYEDEGTYVTKVEPAMAGVTPEEACVRAAVEPAIKGLRLTDGMTTKLTIIVK